MIIIATVALVVSFIVGRRKTAATPGLLLSLFFLSFAFLGATAWNWSRDQNGAGLPGQIAADPNLYGIGTGAFASAALGASIAAILGGMTSRQLFTFASINRILRTPRLGTITQVASVIALALWLVGQGTNLWFRQNYMDTNGSQAFLTTFSLIGPLAGISAFLIGSISAAAPVRVAAWILASTWWACTSAAGTRLAVGFVLTGLLACILYWLTSRSIPRTLIAFAQGAGLTYLTLATFAVTYVARGTQHGLTRLAALFASPSVPQPFDLNTWVPGLKWLVSSIAASFPLTEQSALRAPPTEIILANLNPLPASLLNIDPYTFERLWPWAWVPLGFVGEVYGAFGPISVTILFFAVALSAGIGAAWLQRKGLDIAIVAILVTTVALGFLAIQYPSRSAGRVISFVTIGPYLAVLVVNLAKLFRLKTRPPTAKQLHQAGAPRDVEV
ncbi:hypothetical protein [Curtobacterium citreum]|uniref:Oligosaccharide repeat unit polymerase n=1 Tax=Curtobacterium citreum TaxID=2036 RepID=A0ABT2HIY7_9MICO|nr:hypothetical protein [Curtobacterium citreum]MCS6523219.1 hypothetical protein [Curtobacterium citreum]TQJ26890.1 iron complex transport system permease protein [Curtobacterium citreum]